MTSTECAAHGFAHGMGQSGFGPLVKGAWWSLRVQLLQGGHHGSDLSIPRRYYRVVRAKDAKRANWGDTKRKLRKTRNGANVLFDSDFRRFRSGGMVCLPS